jgi:secreted trypsin-like serine protease
MGRLSLSLMLFSTNLYAVINGQNLYESDPLSKSVVAIQGQYLNEKGEVEYYHGSATVIGSRAVLTAGHLAEVPAEALEIIFSPVPEWDLTGFSKERRIKVVKKLVHDDYENNSQTPPKNDIAILVLTEDIPNDYQALPVADSSDALPSLGNHLLIAGYGVSEQGNRDLKDLRLRMAARPRIPPPNANDDFGAKLWVDQSTGGGCGGDSGGPALFYSGGKLKIFGVFGHVGYKNGTMTCLTQGAFASVWYHRTWIGKVLSEL